MLRFVFYGTPNYVHISDYSAGEWTTTDVDQPEDCCVTWPIHDRMFISDECNMSSSFTDRTIYEITADKEIFAANCTSISPGSSYTPFVDANGIVYTFAYDANEVSMSSNDTLFKWNIDKPTIDDGVRFDCPMIVGDRIRLAASCNDRPLCNDIDIVRLSTIPGQLSFESAVGAVDQNTILAYIMLDDRIYVRDVRVRDPFTIDACPVTATLLGDDELLTVSTATILQTNMIASAHADCVRVIDMRSPAHAYDLPPIPGYIDIYGPGAKFVAF